MQELLVGREERGQRLDKYLRRRLPLAPSSFIYKTLRKKNITLRGRKADGSERVETGDSVRLFLSEETIRRFSMPRDDAQARKEAGDDLRACRTLRPLLGPSPVLYEDDNILVVRKPSGVLSQKADTGDLSMNEWLRGYLRQKNKGCEGGAEPAAAFRPSVCNRLDRNTGGILLCAKTLQGSRALSAVIRDRAIRKTYTMVVHGQIRAPGVIDNELVKDGEQNQVRIASAGRESNGSGRRAVTVYRPVKTGKKASMVEADLITGRSHQLRVHMASIGHPIVSDPRYGDRSLDNALLHGTRNPQSKLSGRNKENLQGAPAGKGRRGGQLLWCSEVSFPGAADAGEMGDILSRVAGRVFRCPPPPWWSELCEA